MISAIILPSCYMWFRHQSILKIDHIINDQRFYFHLIVRFRAIHGNFLKIVANSPKSWQIRCFYGIIVRSIMNAYLSITLIYHEMQFFSLCFFFHSNRASDPHNRLSFANRSPNRSLNRSQNGKSAAIHGKSGVNHGKWGVNRGKSDAIHGKSIGNRGNGLKWSWVTLFQLLSIIMLFNVLRSSCRGRFHFGTSIANMNISFKKRKHRDEWSGFNRKMVL